MMKSTLIHKGVHRSKRGPDRVGPKTE